MNRILIISYTDLKRDPRPKRQIEFLCNYFKVDAVGTDPNGKEERFYKLCKSHFLIQLIKLPLLLIGFYDLFYWDYYKKKLLKQIKNNLYSIIIVHEIRLVPLAKKICNSAKILLDAHEFSPNNFDDNILWRLFFKNYYTYLCYKYLSVCDDIITVTDGIAKQYKKMFNVNCKVLQNSAYYHELEPGQIDPECIKIIHHGDASSSRRLELTIEMMDFLPLNYKLYLMLVVSRVNRKYFNKLKKLSHGKNIEFLDPVEFEEIIPFTNKFDIGITFHPPINSNIEYGLGNKFFEFVQARLAIAIGPLVEMKKIVEKYNIGIVSKGFRAEDMASAIQNISIEKLFELKNNSHKIAKNLSFESNNKKLLNIVNDLVNNREVRC